MTVQNDILEMHTGGMQPKEIAKELGITEMLVNEALGISVEKADPRAVIVDYKDDTVPVPEILRKHRLTYTQLYTILNKNDVQLRKIAGARTKQSRLDQAVKMYQDNVSLYKITQETGIAQPTLHAELHARKIELRRPRKVREE